MIVKLSLFLLLKVIANSKEKLIAIVGRAITVHSEMEERSKETILKKYAKKKKGDNFRRSNSEKPNIVIAIWKND